MNIFLSHASEQKSLAEAVAFSLRNRGYKVFLDRDDLPPGKDYDHQIKRAVEASDLMVFLISPHSVAKGRYTLTELAYARRKWGKPHGRILPVMAAPTGMSEVPQFLKAVTILEPAGNIAAEVGSVVASMQSTAQKRAALVLGGLGLAAGVISAIYMVTVGSEAIARPDLRVVPGVIYGAALAAALFLTLRLQPKLLAIVVAGVALSWMISFQMIWVFPDNLQLELGSRTLDDQSNEQLAWQSIHLNQILGMLTAGATGSCGTWLSLSLFAHALRSFKVFALVVLVGAITGLAYFAAPQTPTHAAFWLVIFCTFQTAVGMTLGYFLTRPVEK